jgi:ABC-type nickel/cobalt efflux system permease component RcnA
MRRRLRLATLILVSQMLLMALAFAWFLQMVIIAKEGSAYFIENNPLILYGEIAGALLIIIFGLYVLVTQIRRLGERRESDRRVDAKHDEVPNPRQD